MLKLIESSWCNKCKLWRKYSLQWTKGFKSKNKYQRPQRSWWRLPKYNIWIWKSYHLLLYWWMLLESLCIRGTPRRLFKRNSKCQMDLQWNVGLVLCWLIHKRYLIQPNFWHHSWACLYQNVPIKMAIFSGVWNFVLDIYCGLIKILSFSDISSH